jgi:predicted transcriptional regulator
MPTKTVAERKKATSKTTPKRTLTQAEIQASIDRLDADMERAGKGRKYTHAEIKKKYGL